MRRLEIVGIGAGDPGYLTVQAIEALNRADVFFVPDKGEEKDELVHLRRAICERYVEGPRWRMVGIPDPPRDRQASAYDQSVARWHEERLERWAEAIDRELDPSGTGVFLAWGDPAIYDSTLRILRTVAARWAGEATVGVVPGISAPQALAARHGVSLTRVGRPVLVTTGRALATGWPAGVEDVVVLLDAHCTFLEVAPGDTEIFWGAYLGTPDEILLSGTVAGCGRTIERARTEARQAKGWIFDTYLLRRPG